MKKLYATLLAAMLAVIPALHGCKDADMEAELAARNARLDELEKQDQEIRNILYAKLNALRGKLLPIIAQVESDLKKKIDNESDKIIHALEENIKSMTKRIDDGFADAQAYINKNMQGCYDDINDSFTALFECKQAVEDGLRKAIKDHDADLEALLRKYEKQIDGIMNRADAFQTALSSLENKIKDTETIDALLDDYHSRCKDLQDAYSQMEEQEAKLLDAMGKLVSQEYLASIEIDQINELEDLLSAAEIVVDDLEMCRSDIENHLSASDGILSEMMSVADMAEGDLMDMLMDAVSDGDDLRSQADDLQNYLSGYDADSYYDEVENTLSELEDSYLDAYDAIEYLISEIDQLKESAPDRCEEVGNYLSDAEDLYQSAIDSYQELEPYLEYFGIK